VKTCIDNQAIYNKSGTRLYANASNSVIGVQMEIDISILNQDGRKGDGGSIDKATQTELISRYNTYYNTFQPKRWDYNFGFFHEHKANDNTYATSYVNIVSNYVAPFWN